MKNINKHPVFYAAQELAAICNPLKSLDITYFAQAHLDKDNNFSVLSNGPAFLEHYLRNGYYNADLHTVGTKLGNYIIWDAIERSGKSDKMHKEAAEFGIQHTFTIIQKNEEGCDYFHFANNLPSKSINQIYLANLDLLKMFILHFKEHVGQSKILTSAYDYKFNIDVNAEGYMIKNSNHFKMDECTKKNFLRELSLNNKTRNEFLQNSQLTTCRSALENAGITPREQDILHHLIKGKTARGIAEILNISARTVEHHLMNIKSKMQVANKSELLQKILEV